MTVLTETLKRQKVGSAQSFRNLAVYPLIDSEAYTADYLTLDEAVAGKLARVTEVSEGGRVPELRFINEADKPILLLDGEELVGAKQNRVLNITILVGAKSSIVIPVSCVEAGRWSYRSREFDSAGRAMYARGRARKTSQVSYAMCAMGSRVSNQSEVWADIDRKAAGFDVHSPTSAMADVYESQSAGLKDYERSFQAARGQAGALFFIDGQATGVELFDSPDTFKKYLPKLVHSYAIDAMESRSGFEGEAEAAFADAFLDRVAEANVRDYPALGLGTDLRLRGRDLTGGALEVDGHLVQLSAFHLDSDSSRSSDDSQILSFSRRRRNRVA